MIKNKILAITPAFMVVAACTSPQGSIPGQSASSVAASLPVSSVIGAPPLRSSTMTVQAKIGDGNAFDWFVSPQIDPDTLVVQCPIQDEITVSFTSDLETQSFDLSGYESVLFDIVVGETTAATRIDCTFPMREYVGDYSSDRSSRGDYGADLAPIFEAYVMKDEPGAAMQVWEKGALQYDYAIGLDGKAAQAARKADDPFAAASVSKEFTAVSILQLIERGALTFDTTIEKFFPGVPGAEDITVYHLLTHSHGLPEYSDTDGHDSSKAMSKKDIIAALGSMKVKFPAGTAYDYGNTSFLMLAHIIEDLTDQKHSTYVTENILKPLGMDQTYFLTEANRNRARVTGFKQSKGVAEGYDYGRHYSQLLGNGDIVSTFADLQKWYRGLSTGKVISPAMFERAATRQKLSDGSPNDRGIGFFVDTYDGEKVIYNSGDMATHTRYIYFPQRDKFVGINTNNSIEYHGYVASAIYLHVVGKLLNKSTFSHFGDDEVIDLTDL